MFQSLFDFLDVTVARNIATMVGTFADVISPLMGACVGLYWIHLTIQLVLDAQKDMLYEYLKTILGLAFCGFVAFSVPWYQANVVPSVLYMGDDIAKALLGAEASSSAGALQTITDQMFAQNGALFDTIDISMTDGDSIVHAILVTLLVVVSFIGFAPFVAVSAAYLMVAKIMVSFLLILGPLFVMFGFFPSTRDMCKTWLGLGLNYILLSVVYPLAFNMYRALLESTGLNGNITVTSIAMTFIIMFALILLATQIPTFVSSLTGGIGINGLVGGIGASAKTAGGLMSSSYSAGEKGVDLMKSAKDRLGGIGKGKISPG